jgi:DNA polymerase elongation subunit (family B)
MKILHLDIETFANKVLAWGLWNQNIAISQIIEPGYTLCWAAKWHDKKEVMFDSLHQSDEKTMLQGVWDLLDEADVIVHYNGTKFDLPKLNTEFVRYQIKPPSPYHQIDLLRTVRSQFKFSSNKLDYVSQQLGLGAKVHHKGMQLWIDCANGCPKAWKIMERYNKQDVRLLPRLYTHILPWIKSHPNATLFDGTERPSCTRCGGNIKWKGYRFTKTMKYRRFQCTSCGGWDRERTNCTPNKGSILVSA